MPVDASKALSRSSRMRGPSFKQLSFYYLNHNDTEDEDVAEISDCDLY